VALESSEGTVSSQLADMNELVCGAGGKTVVVLPVHVEGRCFVVGKLLLHLGKGRENDRRGGRRRKRRGRKVRGRERKREERREREDAGGEGERE